MSENAGYRGIWTYLLKRNQILIFLSLIIVIFLSWTYLIHLNSEMSFSMNSIKEEMSMPQLDKWNLNDFFSALLMWAMMMVAIMLPSAAPMILIFSAVNKKRLNERREFVPTWIFVFGYLTVWIAFSVIAVSSQWILHSLAILSPELKIISPMLSGVILILAGVYQFTPVKNVCLKNCQTPFGFITEHWRNSKKGAFIMGMHHGLYCVGCCWVLMGLLFIVGIMNLLWIAFIALFILIEKVLHVNRLSSWIAGIFLIIYGIWII